MQKSKKAVLKRIKITGTGKLFRRLSRKTHFNAKERRSVQLRGKSTRQITKKAERSLRELIPHN